MTDDEEIGDSADLIAESADTFGGGIEDRETAGTTDTGGTTGDLKEEWNGRTIYLPDDLVDELDRLYKVLDVEWTDEHGEDLPKNGRYYPAVIRAALEDRDAVAAQLGLEDSE